MTSGNRLPTGSFISIGVSIFGTRCGGQQRIISFILPGDIRKTPVLAADGVRSKLGYTAVGNGQSETELLRMPSSRRHSVECRRTNASWWMRWQGRQGDRENTIAAVFGIYRYRSPTTNKIGPQERVGRSRRNALGFEPVGDCGAVGRRLLRWFEPASTGAATIPRIPVWLDGFPGKPSMLERRMSEAEVITEVTQTSRRSHFDPSRHFAAVN